MPYSPAIDCLAPAIPTGASMQTMQRVAFAVVMRACGFGALGIFCVMFGLSFAPRLAFQTGGFLTTALALVLVYKAREALTKNYRKTELWLCLPKAERPPDAYAQWASATVLRETYFTFALWTSAIAVCMWGIALVLRFAGW